MSDGLLDLGVGGEIDSLMDEDREKSCQPMLIADICSSSNIRTAVASSNTTILASRTKARAKLTRLRSPAEKLLPSSSTWVSNVNRETGVGAESGDAVPVVPSKVMLFLIARSLVWESTKWARRRASQSSASVYNGDE
jgi:hypothetical protein